MWRSGFVGDSRLSIYEKSGKFEKIPENSRKFERVLIRFLECSLGPLVGSSRFQCFPVNSIRFHSCMQSKHPSANAQYMEIPQLTLQCL